MLLEDEAFILVLLLGGSVNLHIEHFKFDSDSLNFVCHDQIECGKVTSKSIQLFNDILEINMEKWCYHFQ